MTTDFCHRKRFAWRIRMNTTNANEKTPGGPGVFGLLGLVRTTSFLSQTIICARDELSTGRD
jgi:hypothetical protein